MPMIAVARIARTKQLDDADSVRCHQRTDLRARDRVHTAARHAIDRLSRLVIAALSALSGVHGSHTAGDTAAKDRKTAVVGEGLSVSLYLGCHSLIKTKKQTIIK